MKNANYYDEKQRRDYLNKKQSLIKSLKKHQTTDLLRFFIEYMSSSKELEKSFTKLPWLTLLGIKWSLVHDSQSSTMPLNGIYKNKILRKLHDLSGLVRMPSEYSHHKLFFRNLIFQQYIFQSDFSPKKAMWQAILFKNLDPNSYLAKTFDNKQKSSIHEFLIICFFICAHLKDQNSNVLMPKSFKPLFDFISEVKIEEFLIALSIDESNLSNHFKGLDSVSDYQELYETSEFIKFPIIRTNNVYLVVNQQLLFRALESRIYDTLKSADPEKFMKHFGKLFEKYISNGLNFAEINHVSEKRIEKIILSDTKKPDFVVLNNTANVFVEAKGVELRNRGKITSESKIIKDSLKKSIIKAIEQANEFNDFLNNNLVEEIIFRKEAFLLVVTAKNLGIDTGRFLYEEIAKEKIDKIYSKIESNSIISPDHTFFITIVEFDFLMNAIKTTGMALCDFLKECVERAKNDKNIRALDFTYHLDATFGGHSFPSYIDDEHDLVLEEFSKYIAARASK